VQLLQVISGGQSVSEPDGQEYGVISVTEAARRLQMTRAQITHLLNIGELPGRKIGSRWRLYWPAVVEMLSHPHPRTDESVDTVEEED
jgi:excisionase family DNA binding protein